MGLGGVGGRGQRQGRSYRASQRPSPPPTAPPSSQCPERSSCLIGGRRSYRGGGGCLHSRGSKADWLQVKGCRGYASPRGETGETTSRSLPCPSMSVRMCVQVFSSCQILLDYWNFRLDFTPPAPDLRSLAKGEQEETVLQNPLNTQSPSGFPSGWRGSGDSGAPSS